MPWIDDQDPFASGDTPIVRNDWLRRDTNRRDGRILVVAGGIMFLVIFILSYWSRHHG